VYVRLSLLVGCLAAGAAAQQLTERQALELLRESPHYRELQAQVEVRRAETRLGTLYPNPSANASFEGAGRTDFYLVEQPLALNGRLGLLRQAGASAVAAAEAEADHGVRQIEAQLRSAFYRLAYAQERRAAIRDSISRLAEMVEILRARENEGEGSRFDRLRAEREVVERETEASDTGALIAQYQADLAGFLGNRVDPEAIVAEGQLTPTYSLPPLGDALAAALEARSDYRIERERLEQLRLEAEAADRLRIPNPVVSGGFKRAAIGDRTANGPVFSVSIDLPLFNKGQVEKHLAEAEADRTRVRRQVLENQILAEVRSAYDSLRLRREIAEAYRQQSQNRAAELRGIADVGYREGELGILELLDSYRVEQQARVRLLELQATAKLAEVEFDRAVAKELLP
jgi:cobalt-zinc-cadmium efflux system outer membrane protein